MARIHESLTTLFSDIADSIRAKTGSTTSIVADDFPTAIRDISQRVLLSYSTIGTDKPESKLVLSGYQLTADDLPELVISGYVFNGWWDEALETQYSIGDIITSDTTMYAKWIESEATGLCFAAVEDTTISTMITGTITELPRLVYSLGLEWKDFVIGETSVSLLAGQSMWIKAKDNNNSFTPSDSSQGYITFNLTGKTACSGSVQYLLNLNADRTDVPDRCFRHLFSRQINLTQAPELPAITLSSNCYNYMFRGCSSLMQAPELPAINLAEGCYSAMFQGCSSLTEAPELPSTNLAEGCYSYMFTDCTALNKIKVHFKNWGIGGLGRWVTNTSVSGTFICPNALPQQFGESYIPEGWTVETFEDEVDNVLRQVSGSTNEYSKYYDRIKNMYRQNKLNDLQILVDTHFITAEEKESILG